MIGRHAGAVPMIRLPTQFDPPGTHAAEAAIPGGCGCCCCCCCCCLATTVSISAVAAIQASRKAGEATVRPAHTGLWIGLAGTALLAAATLSGAVAWVISSIDPSSLSASAVLVFGLGLLAVWCALLGTAFRGVGFKEPLVRAVVFAVIGIIAFLLEVIIGAFLVLLVWPVYLLGAAAVIAFVVWMATRPRVPPSDMANSSPQ